jgi:large subunit ribosomal protein L25
MKNICYTLFAQIRNLYGKGYARKLRKNNKIPATIKLKNNKTLSISIYLKQITTILTGPLKRNSLININIKNNHILTVIIKNIQIHKTKRTLEHIDFFTTEIRKKITTKVPLKLIGKSIAILKGGKLNQIKKQIKIKTNRIKILMKQK